MTITAGSNWFLKTIAILAGTASFALASTGQAAADDRLCSQLESELAGANPQVAPDTTRYDSAIARQRDQIVKLMNRVQIAGCGFPSSNHGPANCASMHATLARMESNLDALQRSRDDLAYVVPARTQDEILAQIDANGCRDETASYPLQPATDPAYGDARTIDQILRDAAASEQVDMGAFGDPDGSDEQALPPPDRTGNPNGFEIIAGNPPRTEAPSIGDTDPTPSSSIVKPEPPAPARIEPVKGQADAHEPVERDLDPNRKVRVVGPVFLPDPEGAINLRAPGRSRVP